MSVLPYNETDFKLLNRFLKRVSDYARENNVTIAESLFKNQSYIKEQRRKAGVIKSELKTLSRYNNFILENADDSSYKLSTKSRHDVNRGKIVRVSYEVPTFHLTEFNYGIVSIPQLKGLKPTQVQFFTTFYDAKQGYNFSRGTTLYPFKSPIYFSEIFAKIFEGWKSDSMNVQIVECDMIVIYRK